MKMGRWERDGEKMREGDGEKGRRWEWEIMGMGEY